MESRPKRECTEYIHCRKIPYECYLNECQKVTRPFVDNCLVRQAILEEDIIFLRLYLQIIKCHKPVNILALTLGPIITILLLGGFGVFAYRRKKRNGYIVFQGGTLSNIDSYTY